MNSNTALQEASTNLSELVGAALLRAEDIYDLSSQPNAAETIRNKALALILLLRQLSKRVGP